MKDKRDSQRSKLYSAEYVIHGQEFADMAAVHAYVEKINMSDWWKKHNYFYSIPVEVLDGRGRRKACAIGMRVIKLPKWARYESVILHELTHLVIHSRFGYMVAAHGTEFAKMLLLMVQLTLQHKMNLLKLKLFKHHHHLPIVFKDKKHSRLLSLLRMLD